MRPEDGAVIRRTAWARYNPETGLEDTRDDYELIRDGKVVATEHHERSPATRNYTLDEARACYEAAGFRIERITGGFSDQPYDPDRAPDPGPTRRSRSSAFAPERFPRPGLTAP